MADIIIVFSIIFPVFIGLVLLMLRNTLSRGIIITLSSLLFIAFSVVILLATPFTSSLTSIGGINLSTIITFSDLILLSFLLYISIRYKKVLSAVLVVLQVIPLLYFEFIVKPHIEGNPGYSSFINDNLSLTMMFLILIIGSLIAVFAVKYMDEFEHHNNIKKSRQPFFFFVIFLFLGSMAGLVLSNNLLYMYFFWEMTTLCSFLLISFSKTEEAINNAFRALWMNLIGGVAFIFAIILFYSRINTFAVDEILAYGNSEIIALPLALLAIAAMTKAAQFPFQSWLLGAMVAPTPVSALLHSSTMVKAGVYLLVRFSPLFMNTNIGYAIAVLGGFTFFAASALAIGQSNAKRVLAYSTVANLGLIVATAGIGTPLAVTAAILLIIFHAISKALLFLCVGTIEHGIGSRDIEDMDGLVSKMPLVGSLTAVGMFSMLLPPFGVIITKLLGIEAAVHTPVVLLFIVLGSALTVVFWVKWMGKILTMTNIKEKRLENYSLYTVIPLGLLTLGIIAVSVTIIQINNSLISPYILSNWGYIADINIGSMMLIPIFITILVISLLIPIFLLRANRLTIKNPYLCGENNCDGIQFKSVSDVSSEVSLGNYYLEQFFDESKLTTTINIFALAFIFFMFGVVV